MPIRFACADCGARIKVPDGSEGRKVRCPKCETSQRVPEVSDMAIESPVDETEHALDQLSQQAEAAEEQAREQRDAMMSTPSEENPPETTEPSPNKPEAAEPAATDSTADVPVASAPSEDEPSRGEAEAAAVAPAAEQEAQDAVEPANESAEEPAAPPEGTEAPEEAEPEPPRDGTPVAMNKPGSPGGSRPKSRIGKQRLIALQISTWALRLFAVLAVLGTLQVIFMERGEDEAGLGAISREVAFIFGIGFAAALWAVGEIAAAVRRNVRSA